MKQAIQKAIEGGWHPTYLTLPHLSKFKSDKEVLLDPLFWQAFGKAMGWGLGGHFRDCPALKDGYYSPSIECNCEKRENWQYHWHRFIDHLSEGKDAESFFKDLIKQ
jgi:hypothetical protein